MLHAAQHFHLRIIVTLPCCLLPVHGRVCKPLVTDVNMTDISGLIGDHLPSEALKLSNALAVGGNHDLHSHCFALPLRCIVGMLLVSVHGSTHCPLRSCMLIESRYLIHLEINHACHASAWALTFVNTAKSSGSQLLLQQDIPCEVYVCDILYAHNIVSARQTL